MTNQAASLTDRASRIRLLLMDCDGVLTDGTIYFLPHPDGSVAETKAFDCKDGIALQWARRTGLLTGIITGRGGLAVQERARSVGMKYLVEGRTDKLESFQEILDDCGLSADEVAFVGDDVTDLPLLNRVGLAVAPEDCRPEVRRAVHWVSPSIGGRGVIRDVIELILKARGEWAAVLGRYDI